MDRTYILHRDTQLSEMYPDVAGTKAKGFTVVHKGHYFDRVVKMQQPLGGPAIYGISSVWTVY